VLAHVTEHHSEIPVVLMTGFSSVEGAVDAMKRGAYDYLMKPFNHDEVLLVVRKALETKRLQRELAVLQRRQKLEKGQKLTFGLDPYSGAAQKLRKLTVNLDQLMQAGQTRCQARLFRSNCLRPKGGAALTMRPKWEDACER
jgi:DNA-binding NtrC family response regulator